MRSAFRRGPDAVDADAVDECVSVPIRLGLWQKL
jgi:hypothetical protein